MRRVISVSAAVMLNGQKEILLAQRPLGKSLAGLWEFPGGKIEPGEAPLQSLIRELHEELGIDVSPAQTAPLTFVEYDYPDFTLFMPIYLVRNWNGEPHGKEGQNIAWVPLNRLNEYPVPPADEALIEQLPMLIRRLI